MWVAPERVDQTLARPGIKPEAPSKAKSKEKKPASGTESSNKQSPLERLMPGLFTEKERTQAYVEVMGDEPQRNRTVLETTYNTYANVLANEFMAIQSAKGENATLEPWQQVFMDNVTHHLKKDNSDFDWDKADRDTRYSTFFSTFDKLMRSENKEQAEQWMTTAMLAAKRQIVALQVSTGAHVSVLREADPIEHISDIRAMSALLSVESGRPVAEINKAFNKFDAFLVKSGGAKVLDKLWIFRQIYLADPTAIQRLQNDEDIRRLWNRYEKESRKRLFSTVRIDFRRGGVFTETSPAIDAAQKKYIRQLGHLSSSTEGQVLQKQARDDAEMYMTSLIKAQQDAYYVKFDKQLRTESQLNLVRPVAGGHAAMRPGLSPIRSAIEGVGNLQVGVTSPRALDAELGRVMEAIKKEVTRETLESAATGEIFRNVDTQLNELGEEVRKKELSEADKQRKEGLEKEVQQLEKKQTNIEAYETAKTNLEAKQAELTNKEHELRPLLDAQTEQSTKEGAMSTKETEKANLETDRSNTEKRITELQTRKEAKQKEIDDPDKGLDKKIADREVVEQADITRQPQVEAQITAINAWLTANGGTASRGQVEAKLLELDQYQKEKQAIDKRRADYAHVIAQLQAQKTAAEAAITGFNAQIVAEENSITGAGGLNDQINTKKTEIEILDAEITALQGRIDAGQADLQGLKDLRREVQSLEAQKTARAEELARLHPDIVLNRLIATRGIDFAKLDTDLQGIKPTIKSSIETKQQDIEGIDLDLEIVRLADQRKLEVLQSFKSEVLDADKWHGIFRRAREPQANWDRMIDGQEDSIEPFVLAMKNRPEVPPAYLRMVQIVGGSVALEQTPEGRELYKKISSFITPDVFFDVLTRDPYRENAIHAAYFGGGPGTLPANLDTFNEKMQTPEMKKAMMHLIDANVTQELLAELINRANEGKLGELTEMEKQTLTEIAQREKLVKEQGMETERNQYESQRKAAMRRSEWVGDVLKLEAVNLVRGYVSTIPGLGAGDAQTAVRVVDEILKERKIETRAVGAFAPVEEATIRRRFQDAGITLPPGTAPHTFINNVSRYELTQQDFADAITIQNADTDIVADFAAIAGLNIANRDPITTSVRDILAQHDLPNDLSDTLLAAEIRPGQTLEAEIQAQVNAANGGAAAPMTRDQMKKLVKDIGFVSKGTKDRIKDLDDTVTAFMKRGGSIRDAIWLNAVLSEMSSSTIARVKNGLSDLGKKNREHTLDVLMTFVPEGDRQRVQGRIREYKDTAQFAIALVRGVAPGTINIENQTQVPDNDVFDVTANYLDHIKRVLVGLPAAEVHAQVQHMKERCKANQDLAGITKEAKMWNKMYWGLQGRDLVLALELALGGDAHRDQAIKMAREIEKLRTSR